MVVGGLQAVINSTVHRREKFSTQVLTGPDRTVSPGRIPQGKLLRCSASIFPAGGSVQTKQAGKPVPHESGNRILPRRRHRLLHAGSRRAERQKKEKKENYESGL